MCPLKGQNLNNESPAIIFHLAMKAFICYPGLGQQRTKAGHCVDGLVLLGVCLYIMHATEAFNSLNKVSSFIKQLMFFSSEPQLHVYSYYDIPDNVFHFTTRYRENSSAPQSKQACEIKWNCGSERNTTQHLGCAGSNFLF